MCRSPKKARRCLRNSFDFHQLEARNLLAGDLICTGDADNVIVARVSSSDSNIVEIAVDGVVDSSFDIASTDVISIDGQLGNDLFFLDYSNGAPVTAGGFIFNGGGGVDALESNAADNFFVFEQQASADGSLGDFLTFTNVETLVGGAGIDRFDIRSIDGAVSVDGGAGDDVFRLGSTAPDFFNGVLTELDGDISIEGGGGQNRIFLGGRGGDGLDLVVNESSIAGHNAGFEVNYTSTGGSFTNSNGTIGGVTIFGSNSQDSGDNIDVAGFLSSNSIRIRTSAGDDFINIGAGASGPVKLDGGLGFDNATVNFQGSGNRAVFNEFQTSIVIRVVGTAGDDQIDVFDEFVRLGDEQIQVRNSTIIEAGDGDDTILLDNQSQHRAFGGDGDDTFITTPGSTPVVGIGGNGNDTFDLTSGARTALFRGGDGDDRFFGLANSNLDLAGDAGSDVYEFDTSNGLFFSSALNIFENADAGDSDSLVLNVVQSAFQYLFVDNGLQIQYSNGGSDFHSLSSGLETITLNTTDADETLRFVGTEHATDNFIINSRGGDDELRVGLTSFGGRPFGETSISFDAGTGFNRVNFINFESDSNDFFIDTDLSGPTPIVTFDSGDVDSFHVAAQATGGSFGTPDGGAGIVIDEFSFSLTDRVYHVDVLPEEFAVEFGGRGFVANISEFALADVSISNVIRGTFNITESGTDRVVDLASASMYPNASYTVKILGTDSDDVFELGNGDFTWGADERVLINSDATFFNIIGNGGDDSFQIDATLADVTTRILGGLGDDVFTLGGTNLNALDGAIEIYGGAGIDSLVIDDSAAAAGYSYQIDRNRVFSIPGPAGFQRPDFAGITFGNAQIENLTLQASRGDNLVRVRPSSTTNVNIIGNDGRNAVSLITEPLDGHTLDLNDAESGRWTFDFGYRDLAFEDFEIQHES